MKFQAAISYFYYTPRAQESQHVSKISFCCRPPGVFEGIAGRQQLENTKMKSAYKNTNTQSKIE